MLRVGATASAAILATSVYLEGMYMHLDLYLFIACKITLLASVLEMSLNKAEVVCINAVVIVYYLLFNIKILARTIAWQVCTGIKFVKLLSLFCRP